MGGRKAGEPPKAPAHVRNRLFPIPDLPPLNRFIDDRHRFQVVASGRRAYKTEIGKRKVVQAGYAGAALPWDARFAACAPTHLQAKKIFWKDLKDMIPRKLLAAQPSETELFFRFLWGAEIHVVGLDRPERLEGQPWDGFLFTETDDLKPQFWAEHLRPCLSDRNGWAIFEGVPNGLELLYEFSQREKTDPENWSFHTWKSSIVLPESEIDAVRNELDQRSYLQEYEASFQTAGGRIYYAFEEENIRPAPREFIAAEPMAGIDFNVKPYFPIVIFSVIGGDVQFHGEIILPEGRESNTPAAIRAIQAQYPQVRKVFPDPAGRARSTSSEVGRSDHELLRQAGFEVLSNPSTLSVKDRRTALNRKFRNANGMISCYVDPRCKTLIDSLNRHTSDKDDHVHICDAACYPVDFLFPIKKPADWAQ